VIVSPALWPWVALVVLGAYHGVNPGMGWLFAVALGLQKRSRRALLGALPFLALGHEASVAVAVALVSSVSLVVSDQALHLIGAAALLLFGAWKLLKPAHPKWVGMQVSRRDLVTWSFLMSSAHGAGLMLWPVLLGVAGPLGNPLDDFPGLSFGWATVLTDLAAVLLHSLAMLLVMGLVAIVVYEKVGLAILRSAWINLDRLWALAVLVAGVVTLVS
jgi:hypothetical protein